MVPGLGILINTHSPDVGATLFVIRIEMTSASFAKKNMSSG